MAEAVNIPAPVQVPAAAPKAAPLPVQTPQPGVKPGPAAPPNPQQARLDSLARTESEKLGLQKQLADAQKRIKEMEEPANKWKSVSERVKSDPYGVHKELGLDFATIANEIIKSDQEPPDPIKAAIEPLRKELERLKAEQEDKETKAMQAEQDGMVIAFKGEIAKVVDNAEEYPALSFIPERTEVVWQVINQHWAATGKALSAMEAATLADNFYLDIASKWKGSDKVQARLEQLALAASEAAQDVEKGKPPESKPRAAVSKTPPTPKASPKPGISNRMTAATSPKSDPGKPVSKDERIRQIAAEARARAT